MKSKSVIDIEKIVHEISHYLPAQAPLKDFVHHNTLHAFQNQIFEDAIQQASTIFGYSVTLSLAEFRDLYHKGEILPEVLRQRVLARKDANKAEEYIEKMLLGNFESLPDPRIGKLRFHWKELAGVSLDSFVHPRLFRVLSNYLDQGIAVWKFPVKNRGFLFSIRELEENSMVSLFRGKRARKLLLNNTCGLDYLLKLLVGSEDLYEQYLYDQQFAHPGWSGMVAAIENNPQSLLDRKKITLKELIIFELLLEIDALDVRFGEGWNPLSTFIKKRPTDLFEPISFNELFEILFVWQEALEFSYYDQVLNGLVKNTGKVESKELPSFQAFFCIDDRECSIRRHIEEQDSNCITYGTPGFFQVAFQFQPEHGKFYTKLCPPPVNPGYLIKETGSKIVRNEDPHMAKTKKGLHNSLVLSQTLGFWSVLKLAHNIFRPQATASFASSSQHMDKHAHLSIECRHPEHKENGLQVGFTFAEMLDRVEGLLKSIGLTHNFAPIIYVVGHGASSTNNPYFAAYDCGACSGRPGSVNARVFSYMANKPEVREALKERGIILPNSTLFLGALHDTTRDDIEFYDEHLLVGNWKDLHIKNVLTFYKALDQNSKERARRFASIDTKETTEKIHEQVRLRSVSLFEPRPEYNHATNALCIIGSHKFTKGLFFDRRSFLNSYDYRLDKEGIYLSSILGAAAPVCGGINLEYYFSRVDNQKLGAGSKLPHNVMGLFGLANGIDGDLRTGLPFQMVEIHNPLRLMIIIEQFPDIVLKSIRMNEATLNWFENNWIHLAVVNPETKEISMFHHNHFKAYKPLEMELQKLDSPADILNLEAENLPVYLIA
ncbi:MAG: DUF2309 domain-containing protein [Bacteroidia bacterium]|nr:DUF2309 domain-containing protein [Bacteroidia bacterium]